MALANARRRPANGLARAKGGFGFGNRAVSYTVVAADSENRSPDRRFLISNPPESSHLL
jgi:hypothetical protein